MVFICAFFFQSSHAVIGYPPMVSLRQVKQQTTWTVQDSPCFLMFGHQRWHGDQAGALNYYKLQAHGMTAAKHNHLDKPQCGAHDASTIAKRMGERILFHSLQRKANLKKMNCHQHIHSAGLNQNKPLSFIAVAFECNALEGNRFAGEFIYNKRYFLSSAYIREDRFTQELI